MHDALPEDPAEFPLALTDGGESLGHREVPPRSPGNGMPHRGLIDTEFTGKRSCARLPGCIPGATFEDYLCIQLSLRDVTITMFIGTCILSPRPIRQVDQPVIRLTPWAMANYMPRRPGADERLGY